MKGIIICTYTSKTVDEDCNREYLLYTVTFITPHNTRKVIFGNDKPIKHFKVHREMREFVMNLAKENDLEIQYISSFASNLVDNIYYINMSGNCIPEKFFHNRI